METSERRESAALRTMRRVILTLVAIGVIGMSVELGLVGHYEDANQIIPLALAGVVLLNLVWVALRPSAVAIRTFQFVMLLFAGAGGVGITLHFQANAEFQREIDPSISGLDLIRKVVTATAPPALAPGVMTQLGLLGLVYTYKHPALGTEEFESGHGGVT